MSPLTQQLAVVRMLFDWLITGQVVPTNPVRACAAPKHIVKVGKTAVRCNGGARIARQHHHNLEAYLHAYIDGCGLATDPKGLLFRTIGRGTGELTLTPLPQPNAYAMIRRGRAFHGACRPFHASAPKGGGSARKHRRPSSRAPRRRGAKE
jgi:hypothetical protein